MSRLMWRDTVHKRIVILLIFLFSLIRSLTLSNFRLSLLCLSPAFSLFSLRLSQSNLLPTYLPSTSPKWAEPVSILEGEGGTERERWRRRSQDKREGETETERGEILIGGRGRSDPWSPVRPGADFWWVSSGSVFDSETAV